MGKFRCSCGETLSDVAFPCKHEGILLTETWMDAMGGADGVDSLYIFLSENGRNIMECYECGRLHIQEALGSNKYVSYAPEDGKYHQVIDTNREPEP